MLIYLLKAVVTKVVEVVTRVIEGAIVEEVDIKKLLVEMVRKPVNRNKGNRFKARFSNEKMKIVDGY